MGGLVGWMMVGSILGELSGGGEEVGKRKGLELRDQRLEFKTSTNPRRALPFCNGWVDGLAKENGTDRGKRVLLFVT